MIATVSATEGDLTGTVSYTITGGNDDGLFEIDGTTGAVSLAVGKSLDAETATSHVLTVTADESDGSGTDTATVSITVTDVDEFDPVFGADDYPATVAEDIVDTSVITTVSATEDDLTGTVSYTITGGNDDGLFEIDGATGAVSLAAGKSLDAETATSHVLTVTAGESDGSGTDTATVSITVTNVDEFDPVFGADDYPATVTEDIADTVVIATVSATEGDLTGTVSYTITGGNDDGLFEIDGTTGAVSLAVGKSLDAETATSHVLTVTADESDGSGTDTATVSITVTDVDDTPGITVSPTSGLETTEGGGKATFTIVLDSEPTANVMIGLSSDDPGEGTVLPTTVSFTSGDWNVAQTVTVTGVDDLLVDGDIAYTIVLAAAVSTDSLYGGLDPADVNGTNLDNDVPIAYSYFPLSGTMVAGGASYTAGLEPTAEPFDAAALQATDGDAQSITEGESLVGSKKKPKKSSALDNYQWSFGVVADVTSFQLDAWRDANGESDDFLFEYSLNGGGWTALATVNSTTSQSYDVDLSAAPLNGSLLLRVVDTDRSPVKPQNTPTLESVHVDAVSFESLIADLRTRVNIMATDATAVESPLDNGQFTLSREGTTGDLDVFYTVNGSATANTDYTALTGTATIPDGQTSTTITVTPFDDSDAEGNETVIVILAEDDSYFYKVGASGSATVTITDDDLQTFVATDESTVSGSIVGNDYTATTEADGIVETLQEKRSGGKPAKRTSYLDHRWTFADVNGAESFYVTASRPNNSEGDDFTFEYSTDGGSNWSQLATVTTPSLTLYPVALPSAISGTVLVRVIDTDPSTAGNSVRDTVNIDQMYFSSAPLASLVVDGVASTSGGRQLTYKELERASQRATDYWQQREPHSAAVPIPSSITFEMVQIAAPYLGLAYPEQNHIQIDIDAAGFGWNRVDVFSTLIHEIGHLYGRDHDELGESLTPGVHLEPTLPVLFLGHWYDYGHQATGIRPTDWLSVGNDAEIGDLGPSSVLEPSSSPSEDGVWPDDRFHPASVRAIDSVLAAWSRSRRHDRDAEDDLPLFLEEAVEGLLWHWQKVSRKVGVA